MGRGRIPAAQGILIFNPSVAVDGDNVLQLLLSQRRAVLIKSDRVLHRLIYLGDLLRGEWLSLFKGIIFDRNTTSQC